MDSIVEEMKAEGVEIIEPTGLRVTYPSGQAEELRELEDEFTNKGVLMEALADRVPAAPHALAGGQLLRPVVGRLIEIVKA